MKLLISGYGGDKVPSLQLIETDTGEVIFSGYEQDCSYLCRREGLLFGITEGVSESQIHSYVADTRYCRLWDSRIVEGRQLCHISFLDRHSLLVGACYGSGDIFSVRVDIRQKGFSGRISYYGQGEKEGKAHCVVSNMEETALYSANIMQDRIYYYAIEEHGLHPVGVLQLPAGVGPRHIVPVNETDYYIITEYSNEILLVVKNQLVGRYSTLSPGFRGQSYGSTICMTKDKRFLYAANRGENTVAVFIIHKNLAISLVDRFDCGNFPRDISLCQNDRFLACANQRGNTVTLFELDESTGLPCQKTGEYPFNAPSFVTEW